MTKSEKMAQLALVAAGGAYVYGTSGQACTPALRRKQASSKPAYAQSITRYCPVLSGSQEDCQGCQWAGRAADDCRGLVYRIAKAAGISISSIGSNSQWNADDWQEKGPIAGLPPQQPCMVFHASGSKMNHVGLYLGDGTVVDARGHRSGVVHNPLSSYPWTHYAVPIGAEDPYIPPETRPTLRMGSTGEAVTTLQQTLTQLGHPLAADGIFGSRTLAAVKAFQAARSLADDGIVGPRTWAALDAAASDAPLYTVAISGLTEAAAQAIIARYGGTMTPQEVTVHE